MLQIQTTTTRGVVLQTTQAIQDEEQQPSTSSSDHTTITHNDKEDDELEEESQENQLRGLKYDSCLQPENIPAAASGNRIFSIAPGEGRLPTQILQDQDNEVCTRYLCCIL